MCRLFGLIASPQRVRASFWLLEAPDSLLEQTLRNPDGTGLGYFAPVVGAVVDKEPLAAYEDPAFAREAKHVSSTTFVSHIRYATTGERTTENTHPFAMDGMLFAHNGMIRDLEALEAEIGRDMRFVGGDTDSERYFALIAKEIRARASIGAGISAAVGWIARNLPVYSINFVLATRRRALGLSLPGDESALRARARGRRWPRSRSAPRERHVASARSGPAPLPLGRGGERAAGRHSGVEAARIG